MCGRLSKRGGMVLSMSLAWKEIGMDRESWVKVHSGSFLSYLCLSPTSVRFYHEQWSCCSPIIKVFLPGLLSVIISVRNWHNSPPLLHLQCSSESGRIKMWFSSRSRPMRFSWILLQETDLQAKVQISLFALLPRDRWENRYHSHACTLNVKLEPAVN